MADENENENESLDINDYSIEELKDLFDISTLSPVNIEEKINESIQQFSEEGNDNMINFLNEAKKKLNQAYKSQIQTNWFENEYPLSQDQPIQNSKITSRFNKVQEFDGALQQERLAINQSRPVPYAQGEMNPTLRNVTTKIVSIDSRYRNNNVPALKSINYVSGGIWDASHFTANLSENLNKVMLLRLYSVQIPYTWYNVPEGSNCFMYNGTVIAITPGNYDTTSLSTEINTQSGGVLTLVQIPNTGKVQLTGLTPGDTLTFFQTDGFSGCNNCLNSNQINNTLGWILGFREACYTIVAPNTTLTAEAPIDLNGPKYLLLYFDEFTHNRVNKGIVTIGDTETKLDLPKNYIKTGNISTQGGQLSINPPQCQNDQLEINNCPPENLPINRPFFTQDLPRTITQAQQYSLNEIIKNRKNNPNLKLTPPNPSNILGIIPVKNNNLSFGQILVENANSLTFNTRRYFGPVDIERIEVKLLDDKGNLLNLNGADWSFSLFSEHLYQY
jgi:RNAse (barnase) inhibitor barstar